MRVIGESLRVQGNWVRMSEYPVLSMLLFRLEPRAHEGAGCASMSSPLDYRRLQAGTWLAAHSARLAATFFDEAGCFRGSLLGSVTQQLGRVMPLLWPGRVPDRESSAASANGPEGHLATGPPRLPPQLLFSLPTSGPEDPWCLDQ